MNPGLVTGMAPQGGPGGPASGAGGRAAGAGGGGFNFTGQYTPPQQAELLFKQVQELKREAQNSFNLRNDIEANEIQNYAGALDQAKDLVIDDFRPSKGELAVKVANKIAVQQRRPKRHLSSCLQADDPFAQR